MKHVINIPIPERMKDLPFDEKRGIPPERPYREVEFYREGKRIHKVEAKKILKEKGEKIYLP